MARKRKWEINQWQHETLLAAADEMVIHVVHCPMKGVSDKEITKKKKERRTSDEQQSPTSALHIGFPSAHCTTHTR